MPNEYVFTSITSFSFVICMVFTALFVNFSKYRNAVVLHLAYNLLSFMQIILSWIVYKNFGDFEHSIFVNNLFFVLSSFCLYASTTSLFSSKLSLWPLFLTAFIAVSFIPAISDNQKNRIIVGEFLCVIIPLLFLVFKFRKISIFNFKLYLASLVVFILAHFSICIVSLLGLIEPIPTGGEYYRAAYYFVTFASILISFSFTRYVFSECFSDASAQAKHDYLTGLYSRKFIDEYYNSRKCKLVFGMIDVDNFKNINDTYGHLFGDYVIKFASRSITCSLPVHAVVGRFGGDEFVFVFEYQDSFDADFWFNKLQCNFSELKKNEIHENFIITASCGVVVVNPNIHDLKSAISEADSLLYEVKRNGKNSMLFANKLV